MISSLASRSLSRNKVAARTATFAKSLSTSSDNTGKTTKRSEPLVETGEWAGCRRDFMAPIGISVRGADILNEPLYNKGTAFKTGERDRLRFRGLLPSRIMNINLQKERFLLAFRAEESNIKKNVMLEDLHDRNETLYHRVLVDHIEEVAPIVYTPTVGQACQEFAARFRRPRGMYFSEDDRGQMAAMVYNWPHKDVHVIVVTDGSRILGLGDLGANGMGIPIGKLALYCAAGGIAPHRVLPVVLDVGTDNEELLQDKFYLGVQKNRLRGEEYFYLVEEFMNAVRYRWPNVLVQFEDFSSDVAQTLLDTYRNNQLVFNDDIQGTGATALAGLLCALRATGSSVEALGDQRIVIAGAGSAGIGIAQTLLQAMMEQGRTEEEAKKAFFIVDQDGLLGTDRMESLTPEQQTFARSEDGGMALGEIVQKHKPTMLLGVTAVGGLFTEEIIRAMAANVERPIVFPLSNPTTRAECTAEQAYEWTEGRCIFASGSPFDPVHFDDGRVMYPSQCNNMYVFPGLGLGATVSGAKTVTDRMLYIAAEALAKFVPDEDVAQGKVFPPINRIREVSHRIAVAVVEEAIRDGQATKLTEDELEDIDSFVARKMYYPEYVPLVEKRTITI
ncbi:NAD-dependent malic enzyme [Seminavis robusta]|uniref:NAD-dependent malic enzyme n=1 Tax=Seminavis robusta TaxID=568900 RepID=A0A9N8E462_9STRA|nr:NAD-dependent malic enzyme [Seminavis robusta]|eukprot:Sro637_g179480.1 NAD-dependent malic enzyme (617) ;mRNA; r:50402-52592